MIPAARRFLTPVALTCFCLVGASRALGQDASDWDKESHAEARLIAGSLIKAGDLAYFNAGIEIRLDPGWKTYWRDPGDSGVPPSFDFGGSENVKSVSIEWPAPERFPDGAGGYSVGYVDRVILPLHVAPVSAAKPALLHLKLSYAICGNLCVPAEAILALVLSGLGGDEAVIEEEERRVPQHLALGAGKDLVIRAVHRVSSGEREHVNVDVAARPGAQVELFVEGPTPDWALPLPAETAVDGALHRFSFDLDGLPPGARAQGADLTLTAVAGQEAIEVPVHLD